MDRVPEILNSIRPEQDFASSQDFIEEGLLDSFDVVMLVTALEEAFSILIDGTEVVPENFRNIEAIRGLLAKYGVSG
jgi:acyl carrier protein